ncbi:hypothetical protein PF010_g15909 [Phytophthora fragariae]|uniref:Uncharacterized protein n=1 Tax=Phytophthora fragariae TaxID=53985 RepID=A0A6G0N649_9STRA|nr:hypothetical protein PF010_g15909 [Phytophthora fragariae]KAE9194201.1 hypothetical protein PF004_g20783 [Phytophthora fragariae]
MATGRPTHCRAAVVAHSLFFQLLSTTDLPNKQKKFIFSSVKFGVTRVTAKRFNC